MLVCDKVGCLMAGNSNPRTTTRFGPFEADFQTQELRKLGSRLRLPGQSFQILGMLLDRPGTLVTRDELRQALWPLDTFVDFERGINAAVNRLREALGDSAETPQLIETLPRRGYRFIGAITPPATASEPRNGVPVMAVPQHTETHPLLVSGRTRSRIAALVFAGTTCVSLGVFSYPRWWQRQEFPSLTTVPFTALPGSAGNPAFSSDGSRIAFAWTGDSASAANRLVGVDLYVKNIGSENLLRLTKHPSDGISLAWSPDGTQIAFFAGKAVKSTLAR